MENTIQNYINQREALLQAIVERLSADERFLAAWLTGSFSRAEQDALSDIDITLVVADAHCPTLCERPRMVSGQTTKERYALFSLFGRPALLHENNRNAPESGTFTFVAYEQSAVMVDWILRPLTDAQRPAESRLLFDKAGIPFEPHPQPEDQQQRAEEAAEIMAFFWMMAAVTVKYVSRGDAVFVNSWLEQLSGLIPEVARRIKGEGWQYHRGSFVQLSVTPQDQVATLIQLCDRMENLKPGVLLMGGYAPENPRLTIENLIRIVKTNIEESEHRP